MVGYLTDKRKKINLAQALYCITEARN